MSKSITPKLEESLNSVAESYKELRITLRPKVVVGVSDSADKLAKYLATKLEIRHIQPNDVIMYPKYEVLAIGEEIGDKDMLQKYEDFGNVTVGVR